MIKQWNSPIVSLHNKHQMVDVSRILQSWKLTVLIWLVCLVVTSQPLLAESKPDDNVQKYSVEELVASLSETLTSIDSLYCEFDQVQKKGDVVVDSKRVRYARYGKKWHTTEFSTADDNVSKVENVVCYDGEHAYSYFIIKSPDGSVKYSTTQIHDYQQPTLLSPEYMLGVRISNLNRSITDVCKPGKHAGMTVNKIGNDLYQLKISSIPNGTDNKGNVYTYDVLCDIDTKHDMLPSSILLENSPETKLFRKARQPWYQRWHVTEFKRILDESSKTERWFPVKGILEQGADIEVPLFELSLENIQINANLEENLFNPEIPKGTTIFHMTAKEGGRVSLAGDSTTIDKRINVLADKAQTANTSSSSYFWLVAVNLVLLPLVAFILWWRYKTNN